MHRNGVPPVFAVPRFFLRGPALYPVPRNGDLAGGSKNGARGGVKKKRSPAPPRSAVRGGDFLRGPACPEANTTLGSPLVPLSIVSSAATGAVCRDSRILDRCGHSGFGDATHKYSEVIKLSQSRSWMGMFAYITRQLYSIEIAGSNTHVIYFLCWIPHYSNVLVLLVHY